ncbi:hypothetical protein AAD027_14405 [Pseudoxanthomonas putridarboris]|uniref:Tetratricopeptide repeat-containing protein n=1 Tax=Pseudoxanthomonas putridarboris TaxID=752605 RepID=A0ABU9J3U3_9GAMM
MLSILVVVFRRPLADALWPETRVQQLLDQAGQALQQGRLDAADGTGARQLYEAAQALDNDRSEAITGLQRVGQAALLQASKALEQNRFEETRALLALARDLQVPRAPADEVAARLRARESEHAGIEGFVQAAQQAQQAGRLVGSEDAALPLYRRVLALQPSHLAALEGREDALSDLLQQAGQQLAKGDVQPAADLIAQAREYDPGHVDLPGAQAALARALESRRQQADRDLRRGRLAQALEGYQAVVAVSPDDAQARQGIEQVGIAHARTAMQKAADFRFEQALADLAQARTLAPQSPQVAEAEQSIMRGRQAQARLDSSLPARERDDRVRVLLAQMAQAEARGQWLTPPGDSAYDKLRAAQALAPDHPAVRQAATRLLPATRRCFEDELRGNRIRRAQACLQAWQALQPTAPELAGARRRLAEKWIAVGGERLGAGEVAFAAQALAEARALDAEAPGLEAFAARVTSAQAAQ